MKLVVLLLTVGCLHVSAAGYAQKVTLKKKNASLENVFEAIYHQTGYQFVYSYDLMKKAKKVSIDVKDAPLKKVLKTCFAHQPFTYTMQGMAVIVQKKSVSAIKAAPPIEVTGTVTDSLGNPLIGVTIKANSGGTGTVTDVNGHYTVTVPDDAVLEVSYVGYQTREIAVNGRDEIDIVLKSAVSELNQLVVVGYGVQKKETVTGSISAINGKELVQSPVANISNALAGRLPGLTALQSSGKPGADASTLYIRGVGTYTGETKPLIMVDGIERDNFNEIDPNNVASISILKDASATAVYGVRGANGVILITTKRGSYNETPEISLSAQTAITKFDNMPDFVSSYQYATLMNEFGFENYWINHANDPDIQSWNDFVAKRNANWKNEANIYYSPEDLKYYKNAHTPKLANGQVNPYYDPYFHPDVNWTDQIFKKFTPQSQVNVNMRGGTNSLKYFVSLGYLSQGGLFNTDYLKFSDNMEFKKNRYNLRGNFDFKITKNLKLSVDLASNFVTITGMDNDYYIWEKRILWATPMSSPGMINGKFVLPFTNQDDRLNPLYAIASSNNYNITNNSTLNSSVRLTYNLGFITDGLSVSARGAYDSYFSDRTGGHYTPMVYGLRPNPDGDKLNPVLAQLNDPVPPQRWTNFYVYKWRKQYYEFSLNYDRHFGKHHFTGLILANREKRYDPNLEFDLPHAYEGIVGRVTYAYDSKYLLEYDMGYNGSENFPPGKRFGFLPAYSAGWVVSRESFFPKNSIVSFLKIRGSLGKVGNDNIGGARYLYLPDSWVYTGRYYFGDLTTRHEVQGAEEDVIGNPNVTWEIATKSDIGVDMRLFNDKLTITYDHYQENRKNILSYRLSVPGIVQAQLPPYNLGKVKNWGDEIEVEYRNNTGDFQYWVKGHVSTNQNKIVFMDEPIVPGLEYQAATGHRINQGLYLQADGLYTSWSDFYKLDPNGNPILSEPVKALNKEGKPYNDGKGDPVYVKDLGYAGVPLQPGNIRLVDQNEDGVIDNQDFIRTGASNIPRVSYGLSFGFNYKGFDLSVLLQGVNGVAKFAMRELHFNKQQALFKVDNYRFNLERYNSGDKIYFPIAAYNQQAAYNTFFLKDASYLRLRNMEIGYTLKPAFLEKIGIGSARFYLNGNNLYTWNSNKIWGNPENLGFIGYPLTSTYNFGVNIKF